MDPRRLQRCDVAIGSFEDHSGWLAAASCHGYRPRLHARSVRARGAGSSCALQAQSADPGALCGTQFSYCAVRLVEADEHLVDPVAVYIGGGPPLHPGAGRKVEAPHLLGPDLGVPGAVEDKGAQEFGSVVSGFDGEKAALARGRQRRSHYIVGAARHNGRVGGGQLGRRCYPLPTRMAPQGYGRLAIDAQEAQRGIGGHQQSRAARNKEFGHAVAIDIGGAVEVLPGQVEHGLAGERVAGDYMPLAVVLLVEKVEDNLDAAIAVDVLHWIGPGANDAALALDILLDIAPPQQP